MNAGCVSLCPKVERAAESLSVDDHQSSGHGDTLIRLIFTSHNVHRSPCPVTHHTRRPKSQPLLELVALKIGEDGKRALVHLSSS